MREASDTLEYELKSGLDRLYTAVSLVVLDGREIRFDAAYGLLDPHDPESTAQNDSMFDIASATKPFVATAVVRFVDRKRVSLETGVSEILPEYRGSGKEYVTLQSLLCHTAGSPASIGTVLRKRGVRSIEEARQAIIEEPLAFTAGARVLYSDINYFLLGEVLYRLSGESIDAAVSRECVSPLGLGSAMFRPARDLRGRIATTISEEDGRTLRGIPHDPTARFLGCVAGHAGMFSSAADLAKFAASFSDDDWSVVKPTNRRLMTSDQTGFPDDRRGLGWAIAGTRVVPGDCMSQQAYGHTGFTGVSVWSDPHNQLTVALLTNRVWFCQDKVWPELDSFRRRIHCLVRSLADTWS